MNFASRKMIIAALIVAGVLLTVGTAGATTFQGFDPQLTRAPYLTDLTQTSVRVNWATGTQNTGVVQYGPTGNCTANTAIATKMGNPITIGTTTEYQNWVQVTGLSPSTSYCYRITSTSAGAVDLLGSNPSPQFTTMQQDAGTQPFTFDVLGDWGDTTNGATNDGSLNVNQAGVDSQIAASGAQFALSVGDVAYPGGTQTEYGDLNQSGMNVSAVFGPNFWAAPGQSTPLLGVDGNHGQNVTSINNWPETLSAAASGGSYQMTSYPSIDGTTPGSYPDTYYAFTTGGVRFYMLEAAWGNSNTGNANGGPCGSNCAIYQVDHDAHWTISSAEYQWLQRDLQAHPGGLKFAFFHFPLYTDNATQTTDAYLDNSPGSTNSLEQLLSKNGVQLAFSGHAHIYERNIARPGGVTNYVTGGGGAQAEPVSHCTTTDAYAVGWSYSSASGSACGAAPKPLSDAQVYHFLKISVNGTSVTVTPTNSQGQTFDTQTYNFAPDATPPSAPGNLQFSSQTPPTLGWTPATDNIGVVAYDVYRNGIYLATVGPQVTAYKDSSASSGVSYTYRVAARDSAGNTTSATVTTGGKADTTPPTVPSNLTGSATGYTTASLSWGSSSDSVGLLYYTVVRNGTPVANVPAGTTTYTDTQLLPAIAYSYQVIAVDNSGNRSAASNTANLTTQADTSPPTAPASPTGTALNSSQVLLSWGASTDNVGVVRYDILRNSTVVASVAGSGYIDNVAPSSSNTYQVVAYDAAGNSTPSAAFTVGTPQSGTVFSDGFETGDLSQWTTVSGMTAESNFTHTGTWGAEATSTGSAIYADEALPGSYYELWAKAWVNVASKNSVSAPLFGFRGSNGGSIVDVYLSPTGKLALRNNVGLVSTVSTTSMPTGSWHSVTLHALVNGSSSSVDVSLDGNPVPGLTLTGQNFGFNPITTFELGNTPSGGTYDIYYDDVAVSQSLLTAPAAPTLSGTTGNGAVSLSWTTPSNGGSAITGYAIYRGTSSGGESLLTTVGVTNSYNDTAVTNGSSYYYEVAAVNAVGTGALSTEVAETPSATAPAAPTLSGTAGNAVASLSWTTPSNGGSAITGYAIYRGTSSGGESLLTTVGVTNSYNDTPVTNGTAYYYEVAAVNSVGTGAFSNEVAETPQSPPAAPSGLAATPAKGKGVQLSWTTSTGATSYNVYRSTTGTGSYALIASTTSTSYKDTATTRGGTYYYQVTAVDSAGESQPSNTATATSA
jgi:fibronectin type 3 domain-containing protein